MPILVREMPYLIINGQDFARGNESLVRLSRADLGRDSRLGSKRAVFAQATTPRVRKESSAGPQDWGATLKRARCSPKLVTAPRTHVHHIAAATPALIVTSDEPAPTSPSARARHSRGTKRNYEVRCWTATAPLSLIHPTVTWVESDRIPDAALGMRG